MSYEILSYVKSVGIFSCHTSSHTAQSTMAKNVIVVIRTYDFSYDKQKNCQTFVIRTYDNAMTRFLIAVT